MRRSTVIAIGGVIVTLLVSGCSGPTTPPARTTRTAPPTPTPSPAIDAQRVDRELASLESEYAATVGVVATDTRTGESVAYNGDHRFGYASTIKAFAAAQFLRTVHGSARDERVRWTAADIASAGYSPVTSQHLRDGLTYTQLVDAAVRRSDNTALNLVLDRIGGPAGLDEALADLGDTTTEVVHREDDLNRIEPGSTADTTTPAAFAADLATVLDGETLGTADTAQLTDWMRGNATGDTLVRAGAPEGWTVADKSGGAGGIRNDVAFVTRPDAAPIVIAVLTTRNDPAAAYDDTLVAKTASVVLGAFER